MFVLILDEYKQDPDPVFKILICQIRMKIDRIRNQECGAGPFWSGPHPDPNSDPIGTLAM